MAAFGGDATAGAALLLAGVSRDPSRLPRLLRAQSGLRRAFSAHSRISATSLSSVVSGVAESLASSSSEPTTSSRHSHPAYMQLSSSSQSQPKRNSSSAGVTPGPRTGREMKRKLEGMVALSSVLTMVTGRVLWVAKERSWHQWQFWRSNGGTWLKMRELIG